jgi:hypothetical protein
MARYALGTGPSGRRVSGKFRNKRQKRVETTRIRTDHGPMKSQEVVRDRPVDLYTSIYANTDSNKGSKYEIDTESPKIETDELLNELIHGGTTIVSDENERNNWDTTKLYVASARRCLQEDIALKILDSDFTDLDTKHLERPMVPPSIKQFDIANIYRTFEDGKEGQAAKLAMTDHGRAHVLDLLGRNKDPQSFKFSIRANHHLIIVINAFNWYDSELDEEDTEGITYKWLFTAGPTNYDTNDIDRIVATDRMLSIENVQREHIGTYSCEVANKYGKKWSFPIEVDVERPGEIREVRMIVTSPEGEESEILTNQFEWIPNAASDEWDEKIKTTDNKQMYSFVNEKWTSIYWNPTDEEWYREEDNTPYTPESVMPERGETWEDADVPGTMTDDGGFRV